MATVIFLVLHILEPHQTTKVVESVLLPFEPGGALSLPWWIECRASDTMWFLRLCHNRGIKLPPGALPQEMYLGSCKIVRNWDSWRCHARETTFRGHKKIASWRPQAVQAPSYLSSQHLLPDIWVSKLLDDSIPSFQADTK